MPVEMTPKPRKPRDIPTSLPGEVRRVKVAKPAASTPRRSIRRSISGVLIKIEALDLSDKPWLVDAMDVNADGLGLVLPRALTPGTEVLLSFRLDESAVFERVPAVVLHREPQAGGGGVRFRTWSDIDRLRLLEYLVGAYEAGA